MKFKPGQAIYPTGSTKRDTALMQINRPILTQHRFRRLVLWMLLLLNWIAAMPGAISSRRMNQRGDVSLPWLKQAVTTLLMIRALRLIRPPRHHVHRWHCGRRLRRAHFRRSLLGSKLRRALGGKDFLAGVTQLMAVLRNLDTHARLLARRMRHKMRRYFRIAPPIEPAVRLAPRPLFRLASADSS